jgi:hypothetical protein
MIIYLLAVWFSFSISSDSFYLQGIMPSKRFAKENFSYSISDLQKFHIIWYDCFNRFNGFEGFYFNFT